MKKILETKRIILREKNDNDLNALKKIIHNKEGKLNDEAYARRWLDWCKTSYQKDGFGLYAAIDKNSGEMIGTMGISMQYIDDEWRPEIGYHLRSDYHRQGIAKEVTTALRDYFFATFDYNEVYSYMNEDNVASYKTAESMGMKYLHLYTTKSGEVCRVYRITRDEWKKLQTINEDDVISIIKMDQSMYKDVHLNSLDEDNKRFVPDEVFETVEIAKEVVDSIILSYDSEDGPFIYAIIRKDDNKNIGYVQLVKIDRGWEIGYHIAKEYTHKGYATRAVNLFLDYLKSHSDIKEIYGIALFDNIASRHVLQKCGFETIFEGVDSYQGQQRKIIRTIKHLK